MSRENKIKNCKIIALTGIVVMGVGSFMACLGTSTISVVGTILLIISIVMTTYGFTYWRP